MLPPELVHSILLETTTSLVEAETYDPTKGRELVLPFLLTCSFVSWTFRPIALELLLQHCLITPHIVDGFLQTAKREQLTERIRKVRVGPNWPGGGVARTRQHQQQQQQWEEGAAEEEVGVVMGKIGRALPRIKMVECLGCVPSWRFWPQESAAYLEEVNIISGPADTTPRRLATSTFTHLRPSLLRYSFRHRTGIINRSRQTALNQALHLSLYFPHITSIHITLDHLDLEVYKVLALDKLPELRSVHLASSSLAPMAPKGLQWSSISQLEHLTTHWQLLPNYRHAQLSQTLPETLKSVKVIPAPIGESFEVPGSRPFHLLETVDKVLVEAPGLVKVEVPRFWADEVMEERCLAAGARLVRF
ncbi:hypothetical protein T439DRAFT_326378 [Meredithblackwellia eburnea MCA 4105]